MIHLTFLAVVAPVLLDAGFAFYPFSAAPEAPGNKYATWQTITGSTTQTLDGAYSDSQSIQLNLSALSSDQVGLQAIVDVLASLDEVSDIQRISPPRLLTPEEADPYETWSVDFRVYP